MEGDGDRSRIPGAGRRGQAVRPSPYHVTVGAATFVTVPATTLAVAVEAAFAVA